ncbi:hypothetical protein MED217_16770 [Leeuwenhoekiella blandensis MED217]|uniref:Uncharacterized protein n=1 Tax=Leeuwenhoekiella blandensis (strain CECT 7118 / CCUG 51940 / KCTC 22103 / MED217) TaxID=398720 RepID=A3XHN0_LEEBM|nr:hypothetical protein MED217_16770 [Leeuwenhoekiella blandensis MED217]
MRLVLKLEDKKFFAVSFLKDQLIISGSSATFVL